MAFRIDPTHGTASELRRLLRSQLRQAAEDLEGDRPPSTDAIHDARKRLKKARSVLRLGVGDLGSKLAADANRQLRDAGHALSGQRDADAVDETLARLYANAGDPEVRRAVESARVDLRSRRPGPCGDVVDLGGDAVPADLRAIRDELDGSAPKREGWDALEPGFARAYRRARKAYRALPEHPSDVELHEWRKRCKDVWYHQRLLADLWAPVQEPVVLAASDLADRLGDDHDLALLLPLLADVDRPVAEAVGRLLDEERIRLQAEARLLGARLLADPPDAWVARHRSWWRLAAGA